MLLFLLPGCQGKKSINDKYLKVYYEYIIDNKQSMKVRTRYLRRLKSFVRQGDKRAKNSSLHLLTNAYHYLKGKTSKSDILIFNEIKQTFQSLNLKVSQSIPSDRINKTWLEDEKRIKTQHALSITSSPDWDKRIYGRWVKRRAMSTDQYRFFEDASYENIEIMGIKNTEQQNRPDYSEDMEMVSSVQQGEYKLSRANQTLSLRNKDKQFKEKVYRYRITNNMLYLDGDITPYLKMDE